MSQLELVSCCTHPHQGVWLVLLLTCISDPLIHPHQQYLYRANLHAIGTLKTKENFTCNRDICLKLLIFGTAIKSTLKFIIKMQVFFFFFKRSTQKICF